MAIGNLYSQNVNGLNAQIKSQRMYQNKIFLNPNQPYAAFGRYISAERKINTQSERVENYSPSKLHPEKKRVELYLYLTK